MLEQYVTAEVAGVRLEEQQAAPVVLDRFIEALDNGREQRLHSKIRDDHVVDVEKQPQAIALAAELLLCDARAFAVQYVVDGNSHLVRNLLHQFQVGLPVRSWCAADKLDAAQTSQRGG